MSERQHLRAVPRVPSSGAAPSPEQDEGPDPVPADRYDVVVVGASIAGCTAATLYGRSGARVALLERSSDPGSYKTLCTHIIQPCAEGTIERLGLEDALAAAGGVRPPAALWTRWGWTRRPDHLVSGEIGPVLTHSIRREKLDPLLREMAAGTDGVDLRMGHTVTGLVKENGRVAGVVARTQGGPTVEIRARLVVAADGRHSPVAELSGTRAWHFPNRRSGYFAYYTGIDHGGRPEAKLYLLEPDVGYVFPTDNDVTILACMFPRKKLSWFKRDPAGNLERLIGRLPGAPDLSGATRISKVIGLVNLPNGWRRRPPAGLVFVGDAFVAADPLFGVGCGWAFQSGEWLAEHTAPALRGSDEALDRACRAFRRTVRKQLIGHFAMTSDYSTGRRYNPGELLLFSAATKDDVLAERVHQFGYRTIPVRKLVNPKALGRAIRVNLAKRGPKAPKPPAFEPPVVEARAVSGAEPAPVGSSPAGGARAAATAERHGADLRRGVLEVGGVRSPYLETGPAGDDEAIVFVHGNPGSSADWEPLMRATGTFARSVAIDEPGFGRADKPETFDYTVGGYADHLGGALEQLGIRRAHLVLHDFGGPWGLEWAARHPERLASLVLVNSGILTGYRWHTLARIWQTPGVGEAFMASANRFGFRSLLRVGQHQRPLPASFVDRMYDDFDRGTRRAVLRLYRASRQVDMVSRSIAERLDAGLAGEPRPTLVVWGRRDPYLPVEHAYRQADHFPGAKITVLDQSGHFPFADDPEAVEAAVVPFLHSVLGRERPLAVTNRG
jgi:flavin-dependent dehydrogenase/pimeloyl-ACP methyl ester carboxylesterase